MPCVLLALLGLFQEAPLDFDRDIRPLLSENCFQCHGPDAAHRKAGLRFDTKEGMFERSDVVVASDPQNSLLIHRIKTDDPGRIMPPPRSGKELSKEDIEKLTRWIEQGAAWSDHWAFISPQPQEVPSVIYDSAISEGVDSSWPINEIDHFILEALQRQSLTPSPETDKRTLIRRATFDLTGLPPSLEEITAFLDDSSENAYSNLIDRLLDSPRFGEHFARYWLDAARYGDTHGLHLDNYREMWPYRDWVVGAFNNNVPYDTFLIEQLAGDLIEDATQDQMIASGFNRCHVTTAEGGSITEEVLVRNVVDRVATTGTVMMGLSLGCAQCHDHKFDPISQQEFYEFFAFFNNVDGNPMDGNIKDHPPVIKVPTEDDGLKLTSLENDKAAIEAKILEALAQYDYVDPGLSPLAKSPHETLHWFDEEFPPGAVIEGGGYEWTSEGPVRFGEKSLKRTSQGNEQHYFRFADTKLRIGPEDRLFAWVYLDPENPPREIMLQFNSDGKDAWHHRAYWGENLIGYGADQTTERHSMGALPELGQWTKLEIACSDIGLFPGHAIHGIAFTQFDGTSYWDRVGIETCSPQEAEDAVWIDDDIPAGAQPSGESPNWQWVTENEGPVLSGTRSLHRSGRGGLHQDFFTQAAERTLQHGDVLFAHVYLDPQDPPRSIQLQFNNGNWEHRIRWGEGAHGPGRAGGADFRRGDTPETGKWIRLEATLDEVGLKPGDKLNGWAFTQVGGSVYWDRAGIRTFGPPDERIKTSQEAWERVAKADRRVPNDVKKAIDVSRVDRSDDQAVLVRNYYVRHVYQPSRDTFLPMEKEKASLDSQISEINKAIPTTLVMKERMKPREAYFLNRGQYDQRGDVVTRKTPAVLPPMDPSLPLDRLGLAKWFVSGEHPLTARVAVNRFWQQLFGVGLVKTSEDFGNQGARPSHPELLDWLSLRFVDSGWNIKDLVKLMMMSKTYRQSSQSDEARRTQDPENRYLWRGPRFRLDAEVIRDQALYFGGLLVEKMGGPSVKPPQPDGLWNAVGYSSSNTARFKADSGPDKVHRRTLYTFIKRTAPPPQLAILDAPNRESCVVRRERTNTPLQALMLMNDPQFVEAARGLGQRLLEMGDSDNDRLAYAVLLVTGRPASPGDLDDLGELLKYQRATFTQAPEQAEKLVGQGAPQPIELASWTVLANLLLNLDEVLTKN